MRVLNFIFILLIVHLFMACNRKTDIEKEEVEVVHVVVESEEDSRNRLRQGSSHVLRQYRNGC